MSGSPSEGKQVQNTNSATSSTNTAGPSPVIAPALEDMTKSLLDWYGKNQTAPGFYPGATVAAPSPAQQAARDTTWSYATNGLNSLGAQYAPALDYLQATAGGQSLDIDNNPYFQKALAAAARPQTELLRDVTLPGLDAKFGLSSRTGGGANIDYNMRAINDLNQTQADAGAKAALSAYQGERALQSSAATTLPSVLGQKAAQGNAYLNLMGGVGAADTAYDQSLINADMQKYIYNMTAQPDWYAKFAQYLQSMYPGGQTVGSGTSSGTSTGTGAQSGGSGGASSLIGPTIGAIGMGVAAYF